VTTRDVHQWLEIAEDNFPFGGNADEATHTCRCPSIAARSLKYVRLAETIMEEQLGPERIATVFRLSACKTARPDCAFILLAGSVSKYKSAPQLWSAEPEATICRALVDDFGETSDRASKFVKQHWAGISALTGGAAAA
jgi:hypothetical protein